MQSADNPHLSARVEHYGAPLASASAVVVLVHGRMLSPEHMRDNIVQRLDLDDVAFVAPAAANDTWYPTSFLAPLVENQPWLDRTMERMAMLRDQLLEGGTRPEQIVWCGFSQGACVVSEFISTDVRRWGGLVALTGGSIGPAGTSWTIAGNFGGMPAYFSNSETDEFVPEHRTRETAERFARAGADVSVEIFLGRAHEIAAIEVERVHALLAALPDRASKS